MARIPYFDLSQASEKYQALLKSRHPLNLYRMLPHAGESAASGFLALGSALLRDNALDARLREIAILRVGLLSQAGYEVHQHKRVARQLGMGDATLAALEPDADTSVLTPDERLVLEFTDAVLRDVKAPDALFRRVADRFGPRETAELVLTIGFYMLVCRFLENFEVDIEPPGTLA